MGTKGGIRMRKTVGAAVLAALIAGGALAEDAALLLANGRYDDGDRVRGAGDLIAAQDALDAAGIDTLSDTEVDREELLDLLRDFAQIASRADGLVVALSGQFVHNDRETWFLPIDSDGAGLVDTAMQALPLSLVLAMLAETPERAILALSPQSEAAETGSGLASGIGDLDLPDGVTVIRGDAGPMADFLRDTVAEPGTSIPDRLDRDARLTGSGHLPANLAFLAGAEEGASAEESAAALYWRLVEGRDTAQAYRDYLSRFPASDLASEAQRRLSAIENDPARRAQAAEEALALSRADRREIQSDLSVLGYDTRGIDGIFGPGTRSAISAWQGDNGEPETSYLVPAQIDAVDRQARSRRAELEAEERAQREAALRDERAYWQQTGAGATERGIVNFLTRYPDGAYAAEAEQRLRQLRGQNRPVPQAEQRAWDRARERGRPGDYRAYIDAYPNGRYVDEARRVLGEMQERAQSDPEVAAAREAEEALGLTDFTRRVIEQRLASLDLEPGAIDGTFDPETRRSIRRYQRSAGLPVTGFMSQQTTVRLLADSLRDVLR